MGVMIPNKVARFLWPTVYIDLRYWLLFCAYCLHVRKTRRKKETCYLHSHRGISAR